LHPSRENLGSNLCCFKCTTCTDRYTEARAALENLAKARAARKHSNDQQDAKRRKLREDLERRERAAQCGKNEEEEAKERLQAELAVGFTG
jgi:hypothetical protein